MVELSSLDQDEAAEVLFAERCMEADQDGGDQSESSSSSEDATEQPTRGIMHTMLGTAPFSDDSDSDEPTCRTDF